MLDCTIVRVSAPRFMSPSLKWYCLKSLRMEHIAILLTQRDLNSGLSSKYIHVYIYICRYCAVHQELYNKEGKRVLNDPIPCVECMRRVR